MKRIPFIILTFLMLVGPLLAHEVELVIDVVNTPPTQQVYIYADAEDNLVFDENFDLTTEHSYKIIEKEAGFIGRTGFDFADDSQSNPPNEQLFYSIYKITLVSGCF